MRSTHASGCRNSAAEGSADNHSGEGIFGKGRVHDAVDPVKAPARVVRVMREHVVATTTGRDIPVRAETICVHSDTPAAVAIAAELAKALRQRAA